MDSERNDQQPTQLKGKIAQLIAYEAMSWRAEKWKTKGNPGLLDTAYSLYVNLEFKNQQYIHTSEQALSDIFEQAHFYLATSNPFISESSHVPKCKYIRILLFSFITLT